MVEKLQFQDIFQKNIFRFFESLCAHLASKFPKNVNMTFREILFEKCIKTNIDFLPKNSFAHVTLFQNFEGKRCTERLKKQIKKIYKLVL